MTNQKMEFIFWYQHGIQWDHTRDFMISTFWVEVDDYGSKNSINRNVVQMTKCVKKVTRYLEIFSVLFK